MQHRSAYLLACMFGFGLTVLLLSFRSAGAFSPGQSDTVVEPKTSSSIAIDAEGRRLIVVNPDSNSVTLVDAEQRQTLREIVVGVDPRTVAFSADGTIAYVANRGSDTVSVIDIVGQRVTSTLAVGDRPYGIVQAPDGRRLYIAEQGADQIRIVDVDTHTTIAQIPVADRPSGIAINGAGDTVYVTHLLSGTVTVLASSPHKLYLPFVAAAQQGAERALADARKPPLSVASTIKLWPDSNLMQSISLSADGVHAFVPHTRANTNNRALTFDTTVFPTVSLIDLEKREHMIGAQIDLGTLDPPGVGLPFDAALLGDEELWVVNAASNDLSVIDLEQRTLAAHIEVGANPRGIVLSPDGRTAYVNNTLSGTVSVIDTADYAVVDEIDVTDIPLPPLLLSGKRLFHSSDDPRLGRGQWISCNTCHFDGEHDGRTWTFGFSGPRNTTSLMGMIETYPLRWSGEWDESADSEFALRRENFGDGLIDGEMHCTVSPADCVAQQPNQGRNENLDALAAFIDSLPMPRHPDHADGQALDGDAQRGRAHFFDPAIGCVDCHPPPFYTDQQLHDVGTTTPDEKIGPAYDTPSLRGLYDSAPYFHDGSAATLRDTVIRPSPGNEHDVRSLLTETELGELIAFLMVLPYNPH